MEALTLAMLFSSVTTHLMLPQGLLSAVCHVESRHTPAAINQYDGNSPSYGICQIKLSTARYLGFSGTAKTLMRPEVNILYAGKYLKRQLTRYKGDSRKAVAAYNAGTYKEKQNRAPANLTYVRKVFSAWIANK